MFALALTFVFDGATLPGQAFAAEKQQVSQVLIQNVNIFDGEHEKLAEGMSVLVEENKISKIAKSIPAPDCFRLVIPAATSSELVSGKTPVRKRHEDPE